jgi:phosphatidylserine decarboxylase
VTPPQGWGVKRQTFPDVSLAKGEEMGRFNMGSTVILLLEQGQIPWNKTLGADVAVQLGQAFADLQA